MAGTDQAGIVERQRRVLPPGWFPTSPGTTPVLDTLLNGFGAVGAWLYSLVQYVFNQTRILTSTDGWLELAALDYYGEGKFPRISGETDAQYAARIQANLLPKADTRKAVSDAVQAVTGQVPRIVEAWQPTDTGVWRNSTGGGAMFWNVDTAVTPFRWTNSGPQRAFQAFITTRLAQVPVLGGNPLISWNRDLWFNIAGPSGSALMDLAGAAPNGAQPIYDAINRTKVEGTIVWVRFVDSTATPGVFTLDQSILDGPDVLA